MATVRDVRIREVDGETFKLVIQTVHDTTAGSVWANTAVHNQLFARRIGGARFVTGSPPGSSAESLTEVGELAEAMTWKSPLSGLPADGEKTVVYCPQGLPSFDQKVEILAGHLKEATLADPGITLGPDIDCNEAVMQMLADEYGMGNHVTGLLQGQGGLSIDGQGYTARGIEAAVVAAARRLGWALSEMKAVVQGFGAVGAHTARNLRRHGTAVHAVSTVDGALIAETDEGLNVEELFADWSEYREQGRPGDALKRFLASPPKGARVADKNDIWLVRADIFIPAARTDVLAMAEQVAQKRAAGDNSVADVAHFVATTGVKVVVEGANHPVTNNAEQYLEDHGVYVLPDYLINCGGLIGCWADWVYRNELKGKEGNAWFDRLNERVPHYISAIVSENVTRLLEITGDQPGGMRRATRELARQRREQLASRYQQSPVSAGDDDGRVFARNCLDSLLA